MCLLLLLLLLVFELDHVVEELVDEPLTCRTAHLLQKAQEQNANEPTTKQANLNY